MNGAGRSVDRSLRVVIAGGEAAGQRVLKRLATTLEQRSEIDPETIATHWQGAGQKKRAAEYFVRAAEQAVTTLAFERAARLYATAIDSGVFPPGPGLRELKRPASRSSRTSRAPASGSSRRPSSSVSRPRNVRNRREKQEKECEEWSKEMLAPNGAADGCGAPGPTLEPASPRPFLTSP